ncbi:hypothetical protein AB0F17_41025 [Nonomuraea sp. NPDC026600]|uniref:hypothetical protein n=1 Tax=Nonomuraea sp. NPDC026600 TaxID=3155363 RepID=UPI0033DD9457
MKRFVLAWAATALAATGAAVAVLGLLGGVLTGTSGRVLSQGEIRAALSTATVRAPGTAAPAASASPRGGGFIRTAGGTVIASCAGGLVTLRSWSPAQGYSVDDVDPGPRQQAMVEFEADEDEGGDVDVRIGCSGDQPITLPR